MAKLSVAAPWLLSALFKDTHPMVDLRGASFDPASNIVELDIVGPGVPDVPRVFAECRAERFTVNFKPVEALTQPGPSTAQPPQSP